MKLQSRIDPASDEHLPSGVVLRGAVERELRPPEQTTPAPPPDFVPDHELLQRVGTGAYGEVWMARNKLGTLRAVKLVYRARFEDDRPYQREFNGILKYEPVSRTHPGLISILHVGINDAAGCFYYVMELADNAASPSGGPQAYKPRTLRTEIARGGRMPVTEAGQFGLRVAEALAYLHDRGLVHRDVKPSNVIFIGGIPKLADIGLITGTGDSRSFVGTEGFIPPEGPGSPQGDIYGLGKLLYELAMGRDRLDFPQLPTDLLRAPEVEALLDFNQVIMKACAPVPTERYANIRELTAELNLFLSGHSLRKARKLENRVRALKLAAWISCALVIVALIIVGISKRQEHQAKFRAQESINRARVESELRVRAQRAEWDARSQLRKALMEQARALVRSGEVGQRTLALDAVRRAAAISNSVELRREAFAALALPDFRPARQLALPQDYSMACIDPSFTRIAIARSAGPVELRSITGYSLDAVLPASVDQPAYFGRWSDDSRFLAVKRNRLSSSKLADVEVWEVATTNLIIRVKDASAGAFAFDPRTARILITEKSGEVSWFDLGTHKQGKPLRLRAAPELASVSSDNGKFAAAFNEGADHWLTIHTAEGIELRTYHFANQITAAEWHPNGHQIGVADSGGTVHFLEAEADGSEVLGQHKAQAAWVAFSPLGRYLVTGGWEKELICWDLNSGRRVFDLAEDSFVAQFRSDGRQCATLSQSLLQIYDVENPIIAAPRSANLGGRIYRAAFSQNGQWIAASGQTGMGVCSTATDGPVAIVPEGADAQVFFSPDSTKVFANPNDRVFGWMISPPERPGVSPRLERFPMPAAEGCFSFCVLSNMAAFVSGQGTRIVPLDALDQQPPPWRPTIKGVSCGSSDGRWLAIFEPFTPVLHVYSVPSLDRVALLTNSANIGAVSFPNSGERLFIASGKQISTWSTVTWSKTAEMDKYRSALMNPSGRTMWLSSFQTSGLYEADTAELLLPLPRGSYPLAISPDGTVLAYALDARQLRICNLQQLNLEFERLGLGSLEQ